MDRSSARPKQFTQRLPVSFRTAGRFARMMRVVAENLSQEVRYAAYGVRRAALWRDDEAFVRSWRRCRSYTLLSPAKLYVLYQLAQNAVKMPGDLAELGVYRGGSALLLADVIESARSDATLHLCDTFMGLPQHDTRRDLHEHGDLARTDFEQVKQRFSERQRVQFHVGLFSETLPALTTERFSLIHVDADLSQSVLECCENLYPRVVTGGFIVFDDYGFLSCPGARAAVDAFFADRPETPVYLVTGQCLVIRQ